MPANVIELVEQRHAIEQRIHQLEDEQGWVWKELIAAVEAL